MITHRGTVTEIFEHPAMGYRYTHGRNPDASFMLPFEFIEEIIKLDAYLGKPFTTENITELKQAIELGKIIKELMKNNEIHFKRAYFKDNQYFIENEDSNSLFKLEDGLPNINKGDVKVRNIRTYREMPSKESLNKIAKKCKEYGLDGQALILKLRIWREKEFIKVKIDEEMFQELEGRLQEGVSTRLILKEDESDNLINEIKRNIGITNHIPRKEVFSLEFPKNQILYGPPGTGKTYNTVLYAVAICDKESLANLESLPYKQVLDRYEQLKKEGRIAFTTFHQSYGYEEFIEGIKPVIKSPNDDSMSDLRYVYADGVFKKFCEQVKEEKDNEYTNLTDVPRTDVPRVFIIDEINRGNISKIFGELITLIEPTKRIGGAEPTTTTLPYTGDKFGVPNNVYLLGTMNTADRSIALLDTALRRRFTFIEMMPNVNVLTKLGIIEVEGVQVAKMLETINERIESLFDREHTIGHSYFTSLKKDPSLMNLAGIFMNSIVPLLQEYFYEDYSKIQFVLGDNAKADRAHKFVLDTDIKVKNVFKGNPDIDLPEKKYTIQKAAFYNAESYKQIY
ncbi:hypothetical protein DL346_19965 [Paenibacillus montanisoli]|uniref:ATPase dynein-related AAA domain-containing protein n=2 Tax=Paenibacillus montanisoli TaxID=2081970 RepID=A0A328TWH6_9BACL|nr:hypothetical protein DL346_19965 [Paenibacillus montanisoli]